MFREVESQMERQHRKAMSLAMATFTATLIRGTILWLGGAWLVYYIVSSPAVQKLLGYGP